MILLAMSGKMGVGKNYVSERYIIPLLINELEKQGKKVIPYFFSFGSCIKAELYSRDPKYTYENMFEKKPGWVRKDLQEYGTKIGRDGICSDIWIRQVELWIKIQTEGLKKLGENMIPLFVIQDVRFINELEFVSSFPNSLIIRVEAIERHHLRCIQENNIHNDTHISETELDDAKFPYYFLNDGSCNEQEQAERIVQYYLKTITK
jgi:hypothetical protein